MTTAQSIAEWALALEPSREDLALAERSLQDTLAVALAARAHPLVPISARMSEAGHWAAVGHVLDFDDLHIATTTHISVVVVPAVLARDGDARAYLAGAGAMARIGTALGWSHYSSGWHITCTAGAPAAAVAAGVARGLDRDQLAHAIALSIPGAGGTQRAFGTLGKSLQVGFAAEAGTRAADLAAAGACGDLTAVDAWLELMGARSSVPIAGEAVPGGLATKLFPCCYAMQRPIGAMRRLQGEVAPADILRIVARTPAETVLPLRHNRPRTGLEGKFSLEYALAAALLDGFPGFESFDDAAVQRDEARRLMSRVTVQLPHGGEDTLLAGSFEVMVETRDGRRLETALALPPGSPQHPATSTEFAAKLRACGEDVPGLVAGIGWDSAAGLLREELPVAASRL